MIFRAQGQPFYLLHINLVGQVIFDVGQGQVHSRQRIHVLTSYKTGPPYDKMTPGGSDNARDAAVIRASEL